MARARGKKAVKTIIAGTRTITDYAVTLAAIQASGFTITEVVSGTAWGPDTHGEQWAEANGIPVKRIPANWTKWGRSAGPERNREMAQYAEALILVWDGESKGSKNMLYYAKMRNLKIYVHKVTP